LHAGWDFDGGANCTADFALSGEEPAPQTLVTKAPQANATDIMEANVKKREIQKEYMEYWNSTAEVTETGRPVDCVICPVAPFPVSATYHLSIQLLTIA
jgi:amidase